MQKGPHLEFSCPGCETIISFSVLQLPEQEHVAPCPYCKKKFIFSDETLLRQLKKFTNLCTAIHDAEEILGTSSIGINVHDKEVNIPFKLLLTRLNSKLDLTLGNTPLTIVFRIEPTQLKKEEFSPR